jgi:hypothetical protein
LPKRKQNDGDYGIEHKAADEEIGGGEEEVGFGFFIVSAEYGTRSLYSALRI